MRGQRGSDDGNHLRRVHVVEDHFRRPIAFIILEALKSWPPAFARETRLKVQDGVKAHAPPDDRRNLFFRGG